MKIIDEQLLNEVGAQAKESPRLRMNYNFHQSLDELCHRFINAVEPGTEVPINSFIDHLPIPEEMKELKSIEDLEE